MGFNSDSISTDRILNLFWRWDISPQHTPAIPFLHTPLSPVPCPALTPHPPKYANCVTTGGASLYKTVNESEDMRHVQNNVAFFDKNYANCWNHFRDNGQ